MAITYGFFDAVYDSGTDTYDRTYTAEQFSTYLKGIISDGVVAGVGDQLAVTVYSGMTIRVGTGRMFLDSRWMESNTVINLTVGAAHATLPRRDYVVVRLDYNNRLVTIAVKSGTAASSPAAPALTRNATYYEMALAEIYVAAGATTITAANITDRRMNQNVCGYVTGLVDQIDTAGMWDRMESEFSEWFDEMKGQLSEDAAGNLQNQISAVIDVNTAQTKKITENANAIEILNSYLPDYIRAKSISVSTAAMSPGMSLANRISLDNGFRFLCWQTAGISINWITSFPIYLASPLTASGNPYWNGALGTGGNYSVEFVYFEIKA